MDFLNYKLVLFYQLIQIQVVIYISERGCTSFEMLTAGLVWVTIFNHVDNIHTIKSA